jgi:hypothetical protein
VKIAGTGRTFGTGPTTFEGTASLTIAGQPTTATVVTNVLAAPVVGEDGTLRTATSHRFVFGDGSFFVTMDTAVLSPTEIAGVYNLNTRAAIAEGGGSYENACARLSLHGSINLVAPEAEWRVTGRVCDCR